MQNLKLEKRDWQPLLDHISRSEGAYKVTIEVDRADIGAQVQVENVDFRGVSYDPKDDDIAIDAGAIEHRIHKPKDLSVAVEGSELISLEILDENHAVNSIKFKPRLNLPDLLLPGDQ
ncbi:DUF5335 domain-containing protein [Rhodomicrobium lacus]|jgi:hypothetical protein|uniref:DUF5335 domain-containing protein n=1 Tax=Rhodomicrobium TaxID=1068 RepID=UPI0026E292CE|nr:DUF5335 domain-containing protein [Rhodomicrobium lacus]WKW50187.1 DUF5335 domain-containing protein [Rhodomicrobium lacus]